MSMEILQDPRVRSVEWRDLLELNKMEVLVELFISVPWILASFFFANMALNTTGQWAWAWYIPALGSSFMFFLTGLRQVHNAYHYAVGISKQATEWFICILSFMMLLSMHAVQFNHLRHHRHCMDEDDVEAMSARMPGWKAMLLGPYFPYMMHKTALKLGNSHYRFWIFLELAVTVAWVSAVFFVLDIDILKYHVIAMAIGQCFTAFFAVWTVHHGCDRSHFIARTVRNPLKNILTYNMFYHVEHHLYPMVPTCKLPELANRLDQAAPELNQMKVF
ncbi:MAG: fatty acid desaturase [Vampirovibrio sp.]|nr:fatty acid desaturase [Vampirovibrio sp.]